jgi:hypothetical protein
LRPAANRFHATEIDTEQSENFFYHKGHKTCPAKAGEHKGFLRQPQHKPVIRKHIRGAKAMRKFVFYSQLLINIALGSK